MSAEITIVNDKIVPHYLWVEKYRPQTINDCILPERIKTTFREFVKSGQIQNLLLYGGAGVGKTTVAKALCRELGVDCMVINASEDSGIDILRTKIRSYASTVSLQGGIKVVILDEADSLQANSTQPALRAFMEEFAANCRFILTCNFKNKIIEPLHSRCTGIDFKISKEEKMQIAGQFLGRIKFILQSEKIQCTDDRIVASVLSKHFPDFRRTINEIQKYSIGGVLDAGVLSQVAEIKVKELMDAMKVKDFNNVRKWVVENLNNDTTSICRRCYDSLTDYLVPATIPNAILILSKYMYQSAFVADQEINLVACLIEIMIECQFK